MAAISITRVKSLVFSSTTVAEKNFGLAQDEFLQLQQALAEGDHRLFEKVFLAHFKDCVRYLIHKDDATQEEAYDTTMETFLHFRTLLVAKKITYGNLRYLLTRMARQQLFRKRRKQLPCQSISDNQLNIPGEQDIFTTEEFDLLARAFKSLGQDCKELLRAFYHQKRSLVDIAADLSLAAPAIRKRKSRCIATLRKHFHHLS